MGHLISFLDAPTSKWQVILAVLHSPEIWLNSHQKQENNSDILVKGKCSPFLAPIAGQTSVTHRQTTLTSSEDTCYPFCIGSSLSTATK
eukprot:3153391-Ditylum_brightwellii.AAC.1